MKVAVCEDSIVQSDLLTSQIKNWANEKDIDISIDSFATAESFLFQWSEHKEYDIIFLDIKLNQMSGIELSNIIREKDKTIDIVFVTGFFKYALHGYRVGALQYLMKPVNISDLHFCLEKTKERINSKDEDSALIIESGKKIIRLDYNEIYYCIMFSPYMDIHTDTEKITLREKISEMEKKLPDDYFVRCHRSYIVNVKHVKSISKSHVFLENGEKIPISRGKYKEINDRFINYIAG